MNPATRSPRVVEAGGPGGGERFGEPALGGTFPLVDICAAQETFRAKAHVGALVLTVD